MSVMKDERRRCRINLSQRGCRQIAALSGPLFAELMLTFRKQRQLA